MLPIALQAVRPVPKGKAKLTSRCAEGGGGRDTPGRRGGWRGNRGWKGKGWRRENRSRRRLENRSIVGGNHATVLNELVHIGDKLRQATPSLQQVEDFFEQGKQ